MFGAGDLSSGNLEIDSLASRILADRKAFFRFGLKRACPVCKADFWGHRLYSAHMCSHLHNRVDGAICSQCVERVKDEEKVYLNSFPHSHFVQ